MKRRLRPFWNLSRPLRSRIEAWLDAIIHAASVFRRGAARRAALHGAA